MSSAPKYAIIGVVVVALAVAAGLGISALLKDNHLTPTSKLSPETRAYVENAMPELGNVMLFYTGGEYARAIRRWDALGEIPVATEADNTMADAYLEYANNVRYYMMDDGSATLKDVESAKARVEGLLAEF